MEQARIQRSAASDGLLTMLESDYTGSSINLINPTPYTGWSPVSNERCGYKLLVGVPLMAVL